MGKNVQVGLGDILLAVTAILVLLFPLSVIGFLLSSEIGIAVMVLGFLGALYFVSRLARIETPRETIAGSESPRATVEARAKAAKNVRKKSGRKPFKGVRTLQTADALWRVTHVIDGDTIRVSMGNGTGGTVRLTGIDAPETVHPSRPIEPFARVASTMATELMLGKRVRLEQDGSQGIIDDYGRVLAYVWLENGTLVNEWLVRNGYARERTYHNRPCRYHNRLVTAQAEARQAQRGIWAN